MTDLASRLANRVQLTTDGFNPYLRAVKGAFANEIDYAQLVKLYGRESSNKPERRYSPPSASTRSPRASAATPTRITSARVTSSG